jgi:hypothetical protein
MKHWSRYLRAYSHADRETRLVVNRPVLRNAFVAQRVFAARTSNLRKPRITLGSRDKLPGSLPPRQGGARRRSSTPLLIDRYRQLALAQGYIGDSVINSVGDLLRQPSDSCSRAYCQSGLLPFQLGGGTGHPDGRRAGLLIEPSSVSTHRSM